MESHTLLSPPSRRLQESEEAQGKKEKGRRGMAEDLNPEIYNRLEKAVLEVFSHSDFHKASIRDIADQAGVSFTTIYKHY